MSTSKPSNFRDLKAAFEARVQTSTLNPSIAYRSARIRRGQMSSTQSTGAVPIMTNSIDSIDAVLENHQPQQKLERPTARLRPSWIAPPRHDRPLTSGFESMKQLVVIEYTSPGLQPPVYIFTDLSDPQWTAVEMNADFRSDKSWKFSKAFTVEAGEYQYKFRLGPGDWWACDDSM